MTDVERHLYLSLARLILANQKFVDLVVREFCREPRGEREKAFTTLCIATGQGVRDFRAVTPDEWDMSSNDVEALMRKITENDR